MSAKSEGTTLARLVLLFRLISASLFVAIAVTHFGSRPAWAETKDDWSLPPTAAGLVEKGAPPEKGKSAPISLRPCKCPDECGKEWQALKDAMDSWYVLQAAAAHRAAVQTFKEEHDAWQGLENDANSFVGAGGAGKNSEAEKAHKARAKANPDYGDRDKLRKKIEELAKALVKCENDKCPVPPNVKFELPPCFDSEEQKKEKSEALTKLIDAQSADLKSSDSAKQKQAASNVKYLEAVRVKLVATDVCEKVELPDPKKVDLPTLPPCWKKAGPESKAAYDTKATKAAEAIRDGTMAARKIIEAHTNTTTGKAMPGYEKVYDEAKKVLEQFQALNTQLDALNNQADTVIKDCPETKTPTGGGGKKETPKKHPKHAQRTATGLYFVTVNTATDGQTWCTYGDGIDTPISLIDEGGNPVAVATLDGTTTLRPDDTSRTSEDKATATPGVPELPPSAPTAEGRTTTTLGPPTGQLLPPPTAAAPPTEQMPKEAPPTNAGPPVEQPSKPTTTLTEVPPQQPPKEPTTPVTEVPSRQPPKEPTTPLTEVPPQQPPLTPTTYDRINAKVRQKVLEALLNAQGSSQEPPPEKGQLVKLTPQDKQEPPTKTKTVENADNDPRGFDKDPLQCTTSVDGECSMQIPTEDRELYGLPGTSAEPSKTYRVSFDKSQTSGGVAETTGQHLKPESPPTDGAEIIRHEFAIGNRTYVRIVYKKPFGLDRDLSRTFSEFYGSKYEEDSCRDKEPGPPLGMQPHSLSGLNQEIPEAMVKLRGIPRNRGATR